MSRRFLGTLSGVEYGDTWPFLVAASHELKAPLALMRQLALTVESDMLTKNESAEYLRRIALTSERALRLVTDLTKTIRLEDGLFSLEPINPIQLLDEVAQDIRPLYLAKGQQIAVVDRHRSMLGIANRELLRSIMLHFADNAVHYGAAGAPVKFSAHTYGGGRKIRLSVRDHGPAVPSDVWQVLAKTLGQRPQPLHNRPDSSGLGLYISSEFARAMQGAIGAIRHRDGTTFYVDINASTQMRLL